MKIIFLDIDGVLNYYGCESMLVNNVYFVEESKLLLLKKIVDATGAYIVLSSSWRIGWRQLDKGITNSASARNFCMLREKFLEYGLVIFSKTPVLYELGREKEIQYWISSWESDEIESYIIIDDEKYHYEAQEKYLIQTNDHEGLLPKHVTKAICLLEGVEVD